MKISTQLSRSFWVHYVVSTLSSLFAIYMITISVDEGSSRSQMLWGIVIITLLSSIILIKNTMSLNHSILKPLNLLKYSLKMNELSSSTLTELQTLYKFDFLRELLVMVEELLTIKSNREYQNRLQTHAKDHEVSMVDQPKLNVSKVERKALLGMLDQLQYPAMILTDEPKLLANNPSAFKLSLRAILAHPEVQNHVKSEPSLQSSTALQESGFGESRFKMTQLSEGIFLLTIEDSLDSSPSIT